MTSTFGSALHIAGANDKMDIVDFSFDPEEKYTIWSGLTGGFFLGLGLFWNRPITGGTLFVREIGSGKPNGIDHERTPESADAVLYFAYRSHGFRFFSIQSGSLEF